MREGSAFMLTLPVMRCHKLLGEPILLIKDAWGGKRLMVDFRPPSAGHLPDPTKEKAKAA